MSEETAVVEAVPDPTQPVAADPALLAKPVMPAQPTSGSAEDDGLKLKLGLANKHTKEAERKAKEAETELNNLRKELDSIRTAAETASQKSLEEQGQFRQLWDDAKKTIASRDAEIIELKAELTSKTEEQQRGQLMATSLGKINSAEAANSQHMYKLLDDGSLRANEQGDPVVTHGGVERPLDEHLAYLKTLPEWQHHFKASGSRGMGSAPAGSIAAGRDNPYREGNLTEALLLEFKEPDLARAFKTEAVRGRSKP